VRQTVTLTTTGRRSGAARPVTLYAFDDDDRLVVVGSQGGKPADPAWVGNLRATPRATVRIAKGADRAIVAHEVLDGERDRLWAMVVEAFPLYATYQRRTSRTIPLFVLEPAAGDQGGRP